MVKARALSASPSDDEILPGLHARVAAGNELLLVARGEETSVTLHVGLDEATALRDELADAVARMEADDA